MNTKTLLPHIILLLIVAGNLFTTSAQKPGSFKGLDVNLSNLYRLSDARNSSINSENLEVN